MGIDQIRAFEKQLEYISQFGTLLKGVSMKEALFFHIRTGGNDQDGLRPHTYCVKRKDNDLYVGYSIVHENDQFCRKTGRELAQKIAAAAATIPDDCYDVNSNPEYPQSIQKSINDIVQKAGEILGLSGKIYVKSIVRGKSKKIPTAKLFEITKVLNTANENQ